jgi:hypothetical protein
MKQKPGTNLGGSPAVVLRRWPVQAAEVTQQMQALRDIVHPWLVLFHDLQRDIYRLGPGILTRYTVECAWLICLLCLGAGGIDLLRRRRFDALLWLCMAGLLATAFWLQIKVPAPDSGYFALAAVAIGLLLLLRSLRQRFMGSAKS